jgi:endo-1,3(4)-beta-glucanase
VVEPEQSIFDPVGSRMISVRLIVHKLSFSAILSSFARDIGNPSPNDPYYTVTRHMDWFAGHSWASGIANGAGSRDQESTGEAINGYYGLHLFAQVTNNAALIDYSRMLLAIEEMGAQTYWHLYPSVTTDTPYPEVAFRDLITVGNVEDWQAGAWLFWGAQRTEIAAIQMLPLTPIGEVTYDKPWVQNVIPYCQGELSDPTIGDAFKSGKSQYQRTTKLSRNYN